jgi:hypothetical protein
MGALSRLAASMGAVVSSLAAHAQQINIRYRDPGAQPMPRNYLRLSKPSSGKARTKGRLGAMRRHRAQQKRERRRARNLNLVDCGGFRA